MRSRAKTHTQGELSPKSMHLFVWGTYQGSGRNHGDIKVTDSGGEITVVVAFQGGHAEWKRSCEPSAQTDAGQRERLENNGLLPSPCEAENVTNTMYEMLRVSFWVRCWYSSQFWWGFIFSAYRNTRRNAPIRLMPLFISHVDPHGRGYYDRPTNNKADNSQVPNLQTF